VYGEISMLTLRDRYPVLVEMARVNHPHGAVEAAADQVLSQVLSSNLWDEVVDEFLENALLAPERLVWEFVPGLLTWSDSEITDSAASEYIPELTVRTRNCLQRSDKMTWGAVANSRLEDLLHLRNFGVRSARDLLDHCVRLSAFDGPSRGFAEVPRRRLLSGRGTGPKGILSEWLQQRELVRASGVGAGTPQHSTDPSGVMLQASNALRLIAGWATSEKSAQHVGDFLQLGAGISGMPDDVREAWSRLTEIEPALLADQEFMQTDVNDLIEDILETLDDRAILVLEKRLVSEEPLTLAELGEQLGVSRERVRQIESKLERRLEKLLTFPRFRPIRWRAKTLASDLGHLSPTSAQETAEAMERALRGSRPENRPLLLSLLLSLAGSYREVEGWWVHKDAPEIDAKVLEDLVDDMGILPIDRAREWLVEQGLNPVFHEVWLGQFAHFRRFDDLLLLWSGSIVDKCVSLLSLRGSPASAEDLVSEVGEGHSVVGARNRFFEDARLMRVSRTLWALRSWGQEEYNNLSEEIGRRIDLAGGRALLSDVVEELVRVFGARETSVRIFATAPMFVLEDGWVRRREGDEPLLVSANVSQCQGAFITSESTMSFSIPIDQDLMRGSGRTIPQEVANFLGVSPDHPRSFAADAGLLRVTWPLKSAFGPSLGATRALAMQAGANVGDSLRLDFNADLSTVTALRINKSDLYSLSPLDAITVLTGIPELNEGNLLDRLAGAMMVEREAVRRVLFERGDEAIAKLLPPLQIDTTLRDALEDLVAILKPSE
jgi:RNA polymerase sigma factor (sigma-70 family)